MANFFKAILVLTTISHTNNILPILKETILSRRGVVMKSNMFFKFSYDAHIAACFDPECLQRGGYKLMKFSDGYRYYPIGSKRIFVIKNDQVVELGQHMATYFWCVQSIQCKREVR